MGALYGLAWRWARVHRVLAAVAVIIVVGAGWYGYKKITAVPAETRYVVANVTRGVLVTSVTGTGQVSVVDQRDVKPKTSGDVTYVAVKNGQTVYAGQLLVQLDTTDTQKAVDDAQIALDQAQLTLQKMQGLTTAVGTIQSSADKAVSNLRQAYESGFNTVSSAFLTLPDVMTGLNTALYGTALSAGQSNIDYYPNMVENLLNQTNIVARRYRDSANAAYGAARTAYDVNFADYKATNRLSSDAAVRTLIGETYDTTKLIADAVKSASNLIQYYKDQLTAANAKTNATADTYLSQLNTFTSQTNSLLSSLLSTKTAIQTNEEALVNVGFDVSDQKIAVAKAERALKDAQTNLAYCNVRAPFAGVVAKVSVKKGDAASAGTAVATLITKQRTAEITLNEVDAAKVAVGQKATITFDAVENLSISGEVSDVDTLGTVSQGVVNYAVQITFDTQDARVKPGMSVSVSIVTDMRQDVLLVASGAIKTKGNISYVEVFEPPLSVSGGAASQGIPSLTPPTQKRVETGISNDTETEITSGLAEGEQVVVRTVAAATTQAVATPSLFGGGGGGVRIPH
ncbi:MAG: efflux RND transporter periplasmic adaptor subunit [Candidatus Jorgensenbacteria bacterium]